MRKLHLAQLQRLIGREPALRPDQHRPGAGVGAPQDLERWRARTGLVAEEELTILRPVSQHGFKPGGWRDFRHRKQPALLRRLDRMGMEALGPHPLACRLDRKSVV